MNSAPPERRAPGRRRRLWIVLAVVVALLGALRLALPSLVIWGIGYAADSQLRLKASARDVELSLLRGSLAIDGLTVWISGDEPPALDQALLGWERATTDLEWTRLLAGEVKLSELEIESPHVRLERLPDGTIDVIARTLAEPPDADPPAAEAPTEADDGGGWPLHLGHLNLRNAGVGVFDAADGGAVFEFELEELELDGIDLVNGAVGLGGIALRGPTLAVDRERLTREPEVPPPGTSEPVMAAEAEPGEPPPDGPLPGHHIDRLQIERAEFSLRIGDQELDAAFAMEAEHLGLTVGETWPVNLQLELDDGSLELTGMASLIPASFEGSVVWERIPIPLLALAARPDLQDWFRESHSTGALEIVFHSAPANAPGSIQASGTIAIRDLAFANPGEEQLAVRWEALELDIADVYVPLGTDEAKPQPIRVHLKRLGLVSPKGHFTKPSTALDSLLGGAQGEGAEAEDAVEPDPAAEQAPSAPAPELRIDRLEIANGTFEFDDESVEPTYRGTFRDIDLSAHDVVPDGPSIRDLEAKAVLPGPSPVFVTGQTSPTDGSLDIKLIRFNLPPTNGYLAASELRITRGSLSTDATVRIDGTRWDVDSEVTLHDITLDKAKSQGFINQLGMPTGVITKLLRDQNGDITLSVPIVFVEGQTKVGLASIITGALREALVGAATIPLKAMGGLVSVAQGGVSVAPIPLRPGLVLGTEESLERFHGMLDLLASQPELDVTLAGRAGPEDNTILAYGILASEGLGELPGEKRPNLFARQRIRRALEERAEGEPGELSDEDEAVVARYVAATEVPAETFEALARERGEHVRERIAETERIEASRVKLLEPAAAGAPGVAIDFVDREG